MLRINIRIFSYSQLSQGQFVYILGQLKLHSFTEVLASIRTTNFFIGLTLLRFVVRSVYCSATRLCTETKVHNWSLVRNIEVCSPWYDEYIIVYDAFLIRRAMDTSQSMMYPSFLVQSLRTSKTLVKICKKLFCFASYLKKHY